jgi:hypothetical protein
MIVTDQISVLDSAVNKVLDILGAILSGTQVTGLGKGSCIFF